MMYRENPDRYKVMDEWARKLRDILIFRFKVEMELKDMFPETIYLPNRYKDKNYLKLVSCYDTVAKYELILEREFPLGMGFKEDGDLFVDPSGGPFMTTGYCISGVRVTKITAEKSIIFQVEKFFGETERKKWTR